jgi:DNA repair protein SbcD/Mre11
VMALPWVSRSTLMATLNMIDADANQIYSQLEARLKELVEKWFERADPDLPVVLAAHASVEGAKYGGERSVMLGADLVLSGSLVRDRRLDYVALGHIHKAQDINDGLHPPVVYPGSIERVDFGEAADDKYFVIANVERGKTEVEWRKLNGRRFIDRAISLESEQDFQSHLLDAIPQADVLQDAIFRLVVTYPRQWDMLLDEAALRQQAQSAFEFHLVRRPQMEARLRLPGDQTISSLPVTDLLDLYWKTVNVDTSETGALQKLASEIITESDQNSSLI